MFDLYGIYNTTNGKLYIGFTNNFKRRWYEHVRNSTKITGERFAIHCAMNKYGVENFIHKKIDEALDLKEANVKEKLWIKCLKDLGYELYNETEGGDGTVGRKMTKLVKETLLKCRRKLTDEQIKEIKDLFATENYTQTELAKQFNISLSQIHRIIKNKNWGGKKAEELVIKKNLAAEDVIKMREMYTSGNYTQKELALLFNISKGQVGRIITRRRWAST